MVLVVEYIDKKSKVHVRHMKIPLPWFWNVAQWRRIDDDVIIATCTADVDLVWEWVRKYLHPALDRLAQGRPSAAVGSTVRANSCAGSSPALSSPHEVGAAR